MMEKMDVSATSQQHNSTPAHGWPSGFAEELKVKLNLFAKEKPVDFGSFLLEADQDDTLGLSKIVQGRKDQQAEKAQQLMHQYATANRVAELRALLKQHKLDVDRADESGTTALMGAVMANAVEAMSVLLDAGADPNKPNAQGQVPLVHAVQQHKTKITKKLLSKNADPEVILNDGTQQTLLHLAAKTGSFSIVNTLLAALESIKDPKFDWRTAKDKSGKTAMHTAFSNKHLEAAMALIRKGADLKSKDYLGRTALHFAVAEEHTMLVKLLIRKNSDVNAADGLGATPLHVAFRKQDDEILNLLLDNNADPNIRDSEGKRPGENIDESEKTNSEKQEKLIEILKRARKKLNPQEEEEEEDQGTHEEVKGGENSDGNPGKTEQDPSEAPLEGDDESVKEKENASANENPKMNEKSGELPVESRADNAEETKKEPPKETKDEGSEKAQQEGAKEQETTSPMVVAEDKVAPPPAPTPPNELEEEDDDDKASTMKGSEPIIGPRGVKLHHCKYCSKLFQRQALGGHTKVCKLHRGPPPDPTKPYAFGVPRSNRVKMARAARELAAEAEMFNESETHRPKKMKADGDTNGVQNVVVGHTKVKKYISRVGSVVGVVTSTKTLRNGSVTYTVQYEGTGDTETMTNLQIERHKYIPEGEQDSPPRPGSVPPAQITSEPPSGSLPAAAQRNPPNAPQPVSSSQQQQMQSLGGQPLQRRRSGGAAKRPRAEMKRTSTHPRATPRRHPPATVTREGEAAFALAALGEKGSKATPEKQEAAAVLAILHSQSTQTNLPNQETVSDRRGPLHKLTDLLANVGAYPESSLLSQAFQFLDTNNAKLLTELSNLRMQQEELTRCFQSEIQVVNTSLHLLREAFGALEAQVIQNNQQIAGLNRDLVSKDRLLLQLTKQLDDAKKINAKMQLEQSAVRSKLVEHEQLMQNLFRENVSKLDT